jgi:hypothetical protein
VFLHRILLQEIYPSRLVPQAFNVVQTNIIDRVVVVTSLCFKLYVIDQFGQEPAEALPVVSKLFEVQTRTA